jgi:hypothetical protein
MADGDPGTPLWWVSRLRGKLNEQSEYTKGYLRYYAGNQTLRFAQEAWQRNFAGLFPNFAFNFCALIVDSVAERMTVEGFRMGDEPESDKAARLIWQRNGMDAASKLAHAESLAGGVQYALVWPVDGKASITIESPEECYVEVDSADRRKRLAGIKSYRDEVEQADIDELWLPDRWYKFRSRAGAGKRELIQEGRNPLGVVPLIPIIPRPGTTANRAYASQIAPVAPMQDTLNKIIADMLVASEFAAFPQRYATGLELAEDEARPGQPKIPWRVGVDRMLTNPEEGGRFGAFPAADLSNYVNVAQMVVQNMAVVSRVPFHYFLLNGGQAPSGEAIQSAEAGLIAVVRACSTFVGEAWEEVMRLALEAEGQPVDPDKLTETMWAEPAYRSEAVVVDAAVKKDGLGVPREQLYADIGYSQTEIARFRAMRAREALDRALTPQPVAPAAPAQPAEEVPADGGPRGAA